MARWDTAHVTPRVKFSIHTIAIIGHGCSAALTFFDSDDPYL